MKYIIELPEEPLSILALSTIKGIPKATKIETFEPYIETDRKAIEDEVWATAIKIDIASEDWNWHEMTYREAKAEYERWKADREQIHIGDEVEYDYSCNDSVKFVVIGTNNGMAYGFKYPCETDDVGEYCELEDIRRTGRSFPEIVAVLKKMREES